MVCQLFEPLKGTDKQMAFPISSKKNESLELAMRQVGLRESDLEESFITSSGPGGQNVNKVATCVVLKHRPTGLIVKCQKERSQAMNRYLARRILVDRLEAQILVKQREKARHAAKIKQQKRKRSRQAKERMHQIKREKSEKKQLRRRVSSED